MVLYENKSDLTENVEEKHENVDKINPHGRNPLKKKSTEITAHDTFFGPVLVIHYCSFPCGYYCWGGGGGGSYIKACGVFSKT